MSVTPSQKLPFEKEKARLNAALTLLDEKGHDIPLDRARAIVETAYTAIDAMKFQQTAQKGTP